MVQTLDKRFQLLDGVILMSMHKSYSCERKRLTQMEVVLQLIIWWLEHDSLNALMTWNKKFNYRTWSSITICARHKIKVFLLTTRNWLIDHVDLHDINMDATKACVNIMDASRTYSNRACVTRTYATRACVTRVYATKACVIRTYVIKVCVTKAYATMACVNKALQLGLVSIGLMPLRLVSLRLMPLKLVS
jgi:hypothetical protein